MADLLSICVTNPGGCKLTLPGRTFPASDLAEDVQVVERMLWLLNLRYTTPDVIEWLRIQRNTVPNLSCAKLFVPTHDLAIEVASDPEDLSCLHINHVSSLLDAWRTMSMIAAVCRTVPPSLAFRPL